MYYIILICNTLYYNYSIMNPKVALRHLHLLGLSVPAANLF